MIAIKNIRSFIEFARIVNVGDLNFVAKNHDKKHPQNNQREHSKNTAIDEDESGFFTFGIGHLRIGTSSLNFLVVKFKDDKIL